jgi:hypothetical protein
MAVMNGKGRNWARVTGTVLGALSLAGSLSSLGNLAGTVLAVVDPLLVVAILVLLWVRPSSAYFSAVGAARQRQRTGYYPG